MRVIPVLDLKGGLVVRGIGGHREEYRPVVSRLTPSALPLDVARAFRESLGLTDLYLADLDAIAGSGPALALYAALKSEGFRLLVDAGVREASDADPLAAAGVDGIVAGLETLAGPTALWELCRRHGGERILFSLDLKEGRPLGRLASWPEPEPWSIAREAAACGAGSLIVLDLARVGGGGGTGTEDLCGRLAKEYPEVAVIAGGGVRGPEDVERLASRGVRGALVASALHDGRIRREDLAP